MGLRDYGLISILTHTASRASAVAALRRGSFYHTGEQWMLHFEGKGGKSREFPVRHDLEQVIFAYLNAAGLRNAPKDSSKAGVCPKAASGCQVPVYNAPRIEAQTVVGDI